MKLLKKIILRLVFSKKECTHYYVALDLKLGKSKLFAAMKLEADEMHNANGKRYYILETEVKETPFVIFNSTEINQLKKDGIIRSTINFNQLAKIALYFTA